VCLVILEVKVNQVSRVYRGLLEQQELRDKKELSVALDFLGQLDCKVQRVALEQLVSLEQLVKVGNLVQQVREAIPGHLVNLELRAIKGHKVPLVSKERGVTLVRRDLRVYLDYRALVVRKALRANLAFKVLRV